MTTTAAPARTRKPRRPSRHLGAGQRMRSAAANAPTPETRLAAAFDFFRFEAGMLAKSRQRAMLPVAANIHEAWDRMNKVSAFLTEQAEQVAALIETRREQ